MTALGLFCEKLAPLALVGMAVCAIGVFLVDWRSMNENVGHNWRGALDDEYDRLVDLSAMAMIAASRKPDFSKQSAFYAKQAIGRRGGVIDDGHNLVRDIALAVFSDVTDRAAEIYLNELRGRFSDDMISALEEHVTAIWRAAFDQMMLSFPLKR